MISCSKCAGSLAGPEAVCPHCGHSQRIVLTRDPHAAVVCPGCAGACDIVLLGESALDLCRRCSGIWFDRGELRSFGEAIAEPQLAAQVAEVLKELRARKAEPSRRVYLSCPVCAATMARKNHAGVSGVIVHSCPEHGVWTDYEASIELVELFGSGDERRLLEIAARLEHEKVDERIRELRSRTAALEAQQTVLALRARLHLMLDWLGFF